jgi:hypothetical protein
MKYMLLIARDEEIYGKVPPEQQEAMFGEYFAFTQQILASGEMVAGDPLHGLETARPVTVADGRTITTDGPFTEIKETIAGYYIVDVDTEARAIELAAQIPDARTGKIEVRPIMELPEM